MQNLNEVPTIQSLGGVLETTTCRWPLPPSNRGCLSVLGCITGIVLAYSFQQRLSETIQTPALAPGPECSSICDTLKNCHLTGSQPCLSRMTVSA